MNNLLTNFTIDRENNSQYDNQIIISVLCQAYTLWHFHVKTQLISVRLLFNESDVWKHQHQWPALHQLESQERSGKQIILHDSYISDMFSLHGVL